MKKVIILSGGLDSTTLLYDLIDKNMGSQGIYALSFDYGSKHNSMELPLASQTCKNLGINHKIINVKDIFSNFESALLNLPDSEEIPEGHYADENMKKTVVPFRNGILLSMAVGYAESIGASEVYYGAHAGDHDIYPDCRKKFIKYFNKASKYGTYAKVEIKAPYSNLTKVEIVDKGQKLRVDYKNTWTCYNPKKGLPCGKCGSCNERIWAFIKNNSQDPLFPDNWAEIKDYTLNLK